VRPGFLWGVSTSAFQLEGSPCADWTSWDCALQAYPQVTAHYERFREDFGLLKELGVNAYRFSLEWSRIQPEEDVWSEEAIEHYQEVANILNDLGIEPMVTLHHFTHPAWFSERSCWHEDKSAEAFLAYVKKMVSAIRGVRYWLTFNEPLILLLGGYLEGCMPPGIRDYRLAIRALGNILRAHGMAYGIIHSEVSGARVGLAHNMAALAPWRRWNPLDRQLVHLARGFYNHCILEAFGTGRVTVRFPFRRPIAFSVPIQGTLDFFGVNYYTRVHLRFNPFRKMGVELRHRDLGGYGLTDMGWEIYPKGLRKVLELACALGVPLIVTENGIATTDSRRKIAFLRDHVEVLKRCYRDGMDIRGYFYWSLLDNYEWLHGLDKRFGLYSVDFSTLERKRTPAASYYSNLIRNFSGS